MQKIEWLEERRERDAVQREFTVPRGTRNDGARGAFAVEWRRDIWTVTAKRRSG